MEAVEAHRDATLAEVESKRETMMTEVESKRFSLDAELAAMMKVRECQKVWWI